MFLSRICCSIFCLANTCQSTDRSLSCPNWSTINSEPHAIRRRLSFRKFFGICHNCLTLCCLDVVVMLEASVILDDFWEPGTRKWVCSWQKSQVYDFVHMKNFMKVCSPERSLKWKNSLKKLAPGEKSKCLKKFMKIHFSHCMFVRNFIDDNLLKIEESKNFYLFHKIFSKHMVPWIVDTK